MTIMRAKQHAAKIVGLVALVATTASCGNVVRDGRAPVFLILDSLQAAPGMTPGTLGSFLLSDVQNLITQGGVCTPQTPCPTIFNDVGSAVLRLALKNPGTTAAPIAPTSNNEVTITRYHVAYRRADGRNTPGVDVPFPFDGAVTITVPAAGTATVGFEIVRHVAKQESPLVQLITNGSVITTLTDITFYGTDRVGNEVTVTGTIQVDFGNFAG